MISGMCSCGQCGGSDRRDSRTADARARRKTWSELDGDRAAGKAFTSSIDSPTAVS